MQKQPATFAIALAITGLLAAAPGAFAADGWQLGKVALQGEPAPGTATTFEAFDASRESGAAVVFVALLSGSPPSWALYRYAEGGVAPLVLPGSPAPGAGGALFQIPLSFPSGAAGDFSFASLLTSGPPTRGLFADTGAGLAPVVLEGDAAPGGGSFAPSIAELGLHDRSASGAVVFRSTLSGAAADSGVFLASGGSIATLVAQGGAAPGGGSFSSFDAPTLDEAGTVVFPAMVTAGPTPTGLFRHAAGTTTALALAGDAAPGTGGATFASFHYPMLGPGDAVIFLASITGGAGTGGVFRASPEGVAPLLLENDPIPETGGGLLATLTSLPNHGSDGALAFSGGTSGGSVSGGVFLREADGAIHPVALAGETAPDAGGASFASFGFVGLDAGGAVAFQAGLSDGRTGLFTALPLAAVPAFPVAGAAALASLLLTSGLLAMRRR